MKKGLSLIKIGVLILLISGVYLGISNYITLRRLHNRLQISEAIDIGALMSTMLVIETEARTFKNRPWDSLEPVEKWIRLFMFERTKWAVTMTGVIVGFIGCIFIAIGVPIVVLKKSKQKEEIS